METAHKGVLNEIEKSRVISLYLQNNSKEDFSSSTEQSKGTGITRAKTQFKPKRSHSRQANVPKSYRKRSSTVGNGEHDLDRIRFPTHSRTDVTFSASEILNYGMLYKTSRGKITSDLTRGQHEHRQYRRFQLTEHSLEYSQLLQRVCCLYSALI